MEKNKKNREFLLAKAFAAFLPYEQREFIDYIESAKREQTKASQMEKVTQMILA